VPGRNRPARLCFGATPGLPFSPGATNRVGARRPPGPRRWRGRRASCRRTTEGAGRKRRAGNAWKPTKRKPTPDQRCSAARHRTFACRHRHQPRPVQQVAEAAALSGRSGAPRPGHSSHSGSVLSQAQAAPCASLAQKSPRSAGADRWSRQRQALPPVGSQKPIRVASHKRATTAHSATGVGTGRLRSLTASALIASI